MQGAGAGHHAHAALQCALEHRNAPIGLQAQQEQLAGLVGGEGQAGLLLGQKAGELARSGELECRVQRFRPGVNFHFF